MFLRVVQMQEGKAESGPNSGKRRSWPALQGGHSSHRLGQSLTAQHPSPLVGLYPPGTFSVPKRKADGKPVWHRGFINDALVCVQELASALTCS